LIYFSIFADAQEWNGVAATYCRLAGSGFCQLLQTKAYPEWGHTVAHIHKRIASVLPHGFYGPDSGLLSDNSHFASRWSQEWRCHCRLAFGTDASIQQR